MPTLSIAFDAKRAFDNRTGLGNYARTLLKSLADHQPDLELTLYAPHAPRFEEAEGWVARMTRYPQVYKAVPPWGGALWRTFGMGLQAAANGAAVFHGLSGELPRGLPQRIKAVVTVHDLIFWRSPHLFPALDRFFYRRKLLHACRRADAIVCISEATRAELLDLVPCAKAFPEKIRVIYQSATARTAPRPLAEPPPAGPVRLVYVGALTRRKNVATVIHALRALQDVDYEFDIVGSGSAAPSLAALIRDPALAGRVRLLGPLPDSDLATVLANATALVYPSTAEGFGIPILEAMLSGLPVIASDGSSLPEAGGDAALYCSPTDPAAWAATLRRVLTDPALREQMRARGYTHAARFAPERIAQEWAALYAEV